MHALLRLVLGLAATGFLAATFVVSVWVSRARGAEQLVRRLARRGAAGPARGGVGAPRRRSPSRQRRLLRRPGDPPGCLGRHLLAQLCRCAENGPPRRPSWSTRPPSTPSPASPATGSSKTASSHECERAYRFGDTFMLAMLDLDNFHQVNNRYGHRVGDKILLDLARRMQARSSVRSTWWPVSAAISSP